MSIEVPANERGIARLFALSMTAQEAEWLRDGPAHNPEAISGDAPAPEGGPSQAEMLGLDRLDTDFTSIFDVADLGDLGLAGYLVDGNGVDPEEVAPDRETLAQLSGWVMIVYSPAFDGQAVTLRPAPQLELIGTYLDPGTDWSSTETLTSESAKPYSAPARSGGKGASEAAIMGRIATVVLILLALFTFLFVWFAQ